MSKCVYGQCLDATCAASDSGLATAKCWCAECATIRAEFAASPKVWTITAAEAVAPIEYAVTYEATYYVQATSREQALELAIAAHEDSPEGSWQIDGSDVSHLAVSEIVVRRSEL